ncbi:unnamed protein product [Alopecurus aequalis]
MTLIDFIELNDDIIDLSSDEETVQDDHIITQHGAISPNRQAMFVLAGEGSQDVQAVFIAASEGRQEATDSRNALEVTASSLVSDEEIVQDDHIITQHSAISPDRQAMFVLAVQGSQDAQAVVIAASEGRQEATDSRNALEITAFSLVMEKSPLDKNESQSCPCSATSAPFVGSQDAQAVVIAASGGRQEGTDSRNALEVTASSMVMEKSPLDKDESQSCPRSATSAPFPSPTATTPKALTSEGGVAKRVRVKHYRKKNYHTSTPRRSPRFEHKPECCNSPVEELAAEQKSSPMLELAEEQAPSTDNAEVV